MCQGLGWGAAPGAVALRRPAAPSAAGRLGGHSLPEGAGTGLDSCGLRGFVSSPQGGTAGSNRLGTGKISGLSMNQRGRNKTLSCQIFLVSLSCQMNPSHVKCKRKMCPPMTVFQKKHLHDKNVLHVKYVRWIQKKRDTDSEVV